MKKFFGKIQWFVLAIVFGCQAPSTFADSCAKIVSKFSSNLKTPQAKKTVYLLWKNYFETRSVEARNQLVEFYMPLVHHFVGPVARRIQFGLEREDLLQVGIVGLMKAIERFDSSSSAAFEHFAGFRIQGEALDFLRDLDDLSRGDRKRLKRLREFQMSFQQEYGRSPSQQELRSALMSKGYSESEVAKMLESESLGKTFSLDEADRSDEGHEFFRHQEAVTDAYAEEGVRSVDQKEFWENFFRRSGFSGRTSLVLYKLFYERKTQKEISKEFNMSDANISLILSKALNQMKSLSPEKLEELKELLAQ